MINESEKAVLFLHCGIDFHRETETVDESACVSLVVNVISLECSDLRIVEGEGRLYSSRCAVALVELHLDFTCNCLLCIVYESGESFP